MVNQAKVMPLANYLEKMLYELLNSKKLSSNYQRVYENAAK
jgi:hypothetical protein